MVWLYAPLTSVGVARFHRATPATPPPHAHTVRWHIAELDAAPRGSEGGPASLGRASLPVQADAVHYPRGREGGPASLGRAPPARALLGVVRRGGSGQFGPYPPARAELAEPRGREGGPASLGRAPQVLALLDAPAPMRRLTSCSTAQLHWISSRRGLEPRRQASRAWRRQRQGLARRARLAL